MSLDVLIGTSGWGYDEWIGSFYPKGLRKEDYLTYFSRVFYTNEINTTFYHIPSINIVENWVKKTPENFKFSAKIPKAITHDVKLELNDSLTILEFYLKAMQPLMNAKKLLAFLIQLPPSFKKEENFGDLRDFIEHWPLDYKHSEPHLVIEFRDMSWMNDEVFNYLKKKKLSYCGVIEPLLPPKMDITNKDLAYIRFHGYGKKPWFDYDFSLEEIKKWSVKLKEVIDNSNKVGIYFNNHFSGYAAKNSLMMMKELKIEPRNYPDKISLLDIQKRTGVHSKGQKGLDDFLG
jgi:uncharacterized protein YecE (DUF72 family)